jgi:peptidoglycan/xylan/chitin deacetylase (PgdA/CDA1 family)
VDVELLDPHRWHGPQQQKRVVFLGRFDVLVKGIDVLLETARRLPDVQFDLYGTEDAKTRDWLNRLKRDLPANVAFHNPIYGIEKARMLAGASIYFQPSRWEGFPVSVAECMYLGVPSAIADTLDIAQLFYKENLGLVVALDAARAADQLRLAMEDASRSEGWSQRGRTFAEKHFHPESVVRQHLELYQQVLGADNGVRQRSRFPSRAASGNGREIGRALVPYEVRSTLKTKISALFDRSAPMFDQPPPVRTVVLCYHSINTHPSDLSIDPAIFRSQLVMLKSMGFRFLNFGDLVYRLLRWGSPRGNVACITLDDGYEDSLTVAAPILAELGIPATVFVTTGLMARQRDVLDSFHQLTNYQSTYLSASQVAQLDRAGLEIGAHSHSHSNLARLTFDQTWQEVGQSKKMLEDAIGKRVSCFAYPFGKMGLHYTPMTVRVVRESGYSGAGAVAFRGVNARQAVRIYQVPRFFITRNDTPVTFSQKIKGHFDWLGAIQEGTPTWLRALISPEDKY